MYRPGDTFAGFSIIRELPGGGMGSVYLASEAALERYVIIKTVRPAMAKDPVSIERFNQEMKALAKLSHRSVVGILTSGEDAGNRWIALQFIKYGVGEDGLPFGLTFENRIGDRLSVEDGLRILTPIGDALDFVHKHNYVHRDLKPANILINEEGAGVLADFGIVKSATATALTGNSAIGTVDYMAPEQCRGDPVDARADVYALGAVIYHWLAGSPPFRRPTRDEVAIAHLQTPLPTAPLANWPRAVPVLVKAMAKQAGDRYPTAGHLMSELADALRPMAGRVAVPVVASATATMPNGVAPRETLHPNRPQEEKVPTLTRIQRTVEKKLLGVAETGTDDEKYFVQQMGFLDFADLMDRLGREGGTALVERVRNRAVRMWAARRPNDAAAQLAVLVFLLGAEKRLTDLMPSSANNHLPLDRDELSELLGACILDSGVHLRLDPRGGRIGVDNLIADVPIVAAGQPSIDAIRMEMLARESRSRGIQLGNHQHLDEESMVERLKYFEEDFGVRFFFGLTPGHPLLSDGHVRTYLSTLDVPVLTYGTVGENTDLVRLTAESLASTLRDTLNVILGGGAGGASGSSLASNVVVPDPPIRERTLHKSSTRSEVPLLFYSYARHRDDKACNDSLLTQLRGLARQGGFDLWVDTRIKPGQLWDSEIQDALDRATAGVLMLSMHFLASTYIMDVEVPKLMDKLAPAGRLMPVVLGECTWRSLPQFARLQAPLNAKPLSTMARPQRDAATAQIAHAIADMCQRPVRSA